MNLFRKRRMKSNSSRESRSKKIRTEEKQACRSYSDQKAEMAKPIRSYWVALLGVPKVEALYRLVFRLQNFSTTLVLVALVSTLAFL